MLKRSFTETILQDMKNHLFEIVKVKESLTYSGQKSLLISARYTSDGRFMNLRVINPEATADSFDFEDTTVIDAQPVSLRSVYSTKEFLCSSVLIESKDGKRQLLIAAEKGGA